MVYSVARASGTGAPRGWGFVAPHRERATTFSIKVASMKTRGVACAATVVFLAGCSSGQVVNEPAVSATIPGEQVAPEFNDQVTNDLPPADALLCEPHLVNTTDQKVALANAAQVDGRYTFYFSPEAANYSSYDLSVTFENGKYWVSYPAAGMPQAILAIGSERINSPVSVASSFHAFSFEIDDDNEARLGPVRFYSAAVNGEHAGTCKARP